MGSPMFGDVFRRGHGHGEDGMPAESGDFWSELSVTMRMRIATETSSSEICQRVRTSRGVASSFRYGKQQCSGCENGDMDGTLARECIVSLAGTSMYCVLCAC